MHLTISNPHDWDVTIEEAERIQNEYRHQVTLSPLPIAKQTSLTAVVAADRENRILAVAVTVDLVKSLLEVAVGSADTTFPYRSGYLAFHLAPAMYQALARLNWVGNVILVSGHGLSHPRRFGLASHLGVLLDLPTIGCARSLLAGNELKPSEAPLIDWVTDAEGIVGIAVYTHRAKKPCILSIGHRCDIESLFAFSRLWMKDHCQPAPMRLARSFLRQQV